MKSNKQRRAEIKAKRTQRAETVKTLDPRQPLAALPAGTVASDLSKLAHRRTYGLLPHFYVDQPFVCRDCASHEVWTAKQQKWWFEEVGAPLESRAVRCRPCRRQRRERLAARGADAHLLSDLCESLRHKQPKALTLQDRKELISALSSKWDGLRVTAAQVLCANGDAQGVHEVRRALRELAAHPNRGGSVAAVARALRERLQDRDLPWAIETYLNAARPNRYALGVLFARFPASAIHQAVDELLRSDERLLKGDATELMQRVQDMARWAT